MTAIDLHDQPFNTTKMVELINDAGNAAGELDMGYEEGAPTVRRGSIAAYDEQERRASIKAIMIDPSMSPATKRLSIQHLMDGRRNSLANRTVDFDESDISLDTNNNPALKEKKASIVMSFRCANKIIPTCNEQTKLAEQMRNECPHYERNCTMIAPCCGAAFGCRICHDECPVLPPKRTAQNPKRFNRSSSLPSNFCDNRKNNHTTAIPEDNNHQIDRHAVVEVICRICYTRQSSKTNHCVTCKVKFGEYHCSECNLWMSASDDPYHCSDCGFCRVGGRDNFKHCNDCGMCIDRTLYSNHRCKVELYRTNCPICQEYLFSSRRASHEMPCGHAIHWDCFRQLAEHDLRCPLCKKTADTRDRMQAVWETTAESIALQPLPPHMTRVVDIMCIDCERADKYREWHFLGTQCAHCYSFNTLVDQIVMQGLKAHEYLKGKIEKNMDSVIKNRPPPVNRRNSVV